MLIRYLILFFSLLYWLATPWSLRAQQYHFQNYTVADGLAQSQVHVVLEDSRSYIWMGTQGGGLCRFDGISFQTFEAKDGLSGNYVEALLEDRQGNIW
ncbi:MAG: two-component regulator propeller domain-containing protein, partial [Bacteroidota bacterium]